MSGHGDGDRLQRTATESYGGAFQAQPTELFHRFAEDGRMNRVNPYSNGLRQRKTNLSEDPLAGEQDQQPPSHYDDSVDGEDSLFLSPEKHRQEMERLQTWKKWLFRVKHYFLVFHAGYIFFVALLAAFIVMISQSAVDRPIAFVDALFMTVSSVTCTGLASVNTAHFTQLSIGMCCFVMMAGGTVFTSVMQPVLRIMTLKVLYKEERSFAHPLRLRHIRMLLITASLMTWTTLTYLLLWHFFAFVTILPAQPGKIAVPWIVSCFNNAGLFIAVPHLDKNWWIMLLLTLLVMVGYTLYPVFLRLYIFAQLHILRAWLHIWYRSTRDPDVLAQKVRDFREEKKIRRRKGSTVGRPASPVRIVRPTSPERDPREPEGPATPPRRSIEVEKVILSRRKSTGDQSPLPPASPTDPMAARAFPGTLTPPAALKRSMTESDSPQSFGLPGGVNTSSYLTAPSGTRRTKEDGTRMTLDEIRAEQKRSQHERSTSLDEAPESDSEATTVPLSLFTDANPFAEPGETIVLPVVDCRDEDKAQTFNALVEGGYYHVLVENHPFVQAFRFVLASTEPNNHHAFLFIPSETIYILCAWTALVLVQMIPYFFLQWDLALAPWPEGWLKIMLAFCQSVAFRFVGNAWFNLTLLSSAQCVLALFVLYLPALPIPTDRRRKKWDQLIKRGAWRLFTSRIFWLFASVNFIAFAQYHHTSGYDPQQDAIHGLVTRAAFEVFSAYATSGVSLSLNATPQYSFAGNCVWVSKVVLTLVMLFGRHRGMDLGIDIGLTELEKQHIEDLQLVEEFHANQQLVRQDSQAYSESRQASMMGSPMTSPLFRPAIDFPSKKQGAQSSSLGGAAAGAASSAPNLGKNAQA